MGSAPRHVVLLSVDALRFDALSIERDSPYLKAFGLERMPNTPWLDRFAREGFRFRGCRTVSPHTPPSHGTLFTGQNPYRHGLRLFSGQKLSPRSPTIFERLRDAGLRALASIDAEALFRPCGLTRGAEMLRCLDDTGAVERFAELHAAGERVFFFFHMLDVHHPYGAPRSERPRFDPSEFLSGHLAVAKELGVRVDRKLLERLPSEPRAQNLLSRKIRQAAAAKHLAAPVGLPLYLQGVRLFDGGRFRALLEALEGKGLLEDTLLVITADHGEAERERLPDSEGHTCVEFDHGHSLKDELLRIPLVFWSRNGAIRAGQSAVAVSNADILPTLLELLRVRFDAGALDGVSRIRELDGAGSAPGPSDCYAEYWEIGRGARKRPKPSGLRSIRTGDLKLTQDHEGRVSLFNTRNDPFERFDLLRFPRCYSREGWIDDHRQVAEELVASLARKTGVRSARGPRRFVSGRGAAREWKSEELLRLLATLGYTH